MGGIVGTGSQIKSIQRGTISVSATGAGSFSNTATISAVDATKAVVEFGGAVPVSGALANAYLVLTNGTTVTAQCLATAAQTIIVPYQVVEMV